MHWVSNNSIWPIVPFQVQPLWAKVDLAVMAMKRYSAFPKAPLLLEPHHQIVWCHIQDTRCWEGFTPLQRCSRCILQFQPTAWVWFYDISTLVGYSMPNLLYTYVSNIWFGLVGFYGISTIVDYLTPNPVFIY